jgi:hypothetical protein
MEKAAEESTEARMVIVGHSADLIKIIDLGIVEGMFGHGCLPKI